MLEQLKSKLQYEFQYKKPIYVRKLREALLGSASLLTVMAGSAQCSETINDTRELYNVYLHTQATNTEISDHDPVILNLKFHSTSTLLLYFLAGASIFINKTKREEDSTNQKLSIINEWQNMRPFSQDDIIQLKLRADDNYDRVSWQPKKLQDQTKQVYASNLKPDHQHICPN